MKHLLVAIAVFLALTVAGGAWYILSNLNTLVAGAIEYYGSRATKTSVQVSGVNVSLTDGKATIAGLSVANPDGFETPHAFVLSSITVDIDTASLTSEPYGIELIDVSGPKVIFEVNQQGKDNLRTMRDNLGTTSEETAADTTQPSPRLAIGRIVLADARLNAHLTPLDERRQLSIPSFAMTNLEGQPAEIARQIVDRLVGAALDRAREEGVARLRERAREELGEELDELGDKAEDELKKRLGL